MRAAEYGDVCPSEVHEAMKRDEAVWSSLDYVGVQNVDGKPYMVLRNCVCGSTIAKLCDCDEAAEAVH